MPVANRHKKRHLTLIIIREMQIKTTVRYHLTAVTMAIIKKSTNHKRGQGCGKKGTLIHGWQECKRVQQLWKIVWKFLKKLKMELPYNLAIPLLSIYLKKQSKRLLRKDTHTPMFIAVLFTIVKIWKQPKYPSTDEYYQPQKRTESHHLQQYRQTWRALC